MGSSSEVRLPDFAGSWYPGYEQAVRAELARFREQAMTPQSLTGPIVAGIVPHAGWMFSGRIAFQVLLAMARSGPAPSVLAIFGKHLSGRSRPTLWREGSWRTPLGDLRIASELGEALASKFDFEHETATAYEPDNTIELQLPFVKELFPDVAVLPIGVPPRPEAAAIGRTVGELGRSLGLALSVLGSTNLTHYGPNYGYAPHGQGAEAERWVRQENDQRVIELLVAQELDQALAHAREHRSACCVGAAVAAVAAAQALGAARGELLEYRSSNDVRPGSASFVGYAGIVFG